MNNYEDYNEKFRIRRNIDGSLDLESVHNALRNLAKVNNANSSVLYVSITDSMLTINGDSVEYGKGVFSQDEVAQIFSSLVDKGAEINPNQKNRVIFNEPILLLGKEEEKEPNITVDLESAVLSIRNLAGINNRTSPVLYIGVNERGWVVNGDGVNFSHEFTEDDKKMIVSKLKELGAEDNLHRPGEVLIKDSNAFWGYGPAIPENNTMADLSITLLPKNNEQSKTGKK